MAEHKKVYYPYLDALKGLAIILMVMGHALAWSYPDISLLSKNLPELTTSEFYASFVWKVIYSFHMPLLICVSGYLFHKNISYNAAFVKEQLKKRVTRLLIPYIVTGVFVLFLKGYFGYWFLQILFILNVIVLLENFIVQSYFNNKRFKWIASHITVFAGLFVLAKFITRFDVPKELYNLTSIHFYYIAFILGTSLKQFPEFEKALTSDRLKIATLIVYVTIFTTNLFGHLKILSILGAVAAILHLWGIFKAFDFKSKIANSIILIGKNSLEIYIFHLFFVISIKEVGDYILSTNDFASSITIQLVYSIALSVIAIILSLAVSKLLKKNKYLSKLILGA